MKFDPSFKERLNSNKRKREIPPFKLLKRFGLRKNMVFVDIGAGTGFFSIPASKIVGEKGRVITLDIQEEMLKEIKRKIKENKIKNIDVYKSKEYKFPLEKEIADFALLSNVLHEVRGKIRFLREIKRVLKKGGIFTIIEWKKKKTEHGPPLKKRLTKTEIKKCLKRTGFKLKEDFDLKDKFNVFICIKN